MCALFLLSVLFSWLLCSSLCQYKDGNFSSFSRSRRHLKYHVISTLSRNTGYNTCQRTYHREVRNAFPSRCHLGREALCRCALQDMSTLLFPHLMMGALIWLTGPTLCMHWPEIMMPIKQGRYSCRGGIASLQRWDTEAQKEYVICPRSQS